MFKHFASKDAIWQAVMSWVHVQLLAALEAAAAGVAQPLQALEAVFEAHLGFVSAHPGVPRVIFHELQNPQDSAVKREVRTLMQSYRALLLRLLRAAAGAVTWRRASTPTRRPRSSSARCRAWSCRP